jgi:hypothetical protein
MLLVFATRLQLPTYSCWKTTSLQRIPGLRKLRSPFAKLRRRPLSMATRISTGSTFGSFGLSQGCNGRLIMLLGFHTCISLFYSAPLSYLACYCLVEDTKEEVKNAVSGVRGAYRMAGRSLCYRWSPRRLLSFFSSWLGRRASCQLEVFSL